MKRRKQKPNRGQIVEQYLRACAAQMGLGAWEISFDERGDIEDGFEANIKTTENQCAIIALSRKFWTHPADIQQRILVHEICHLYFDRLREHVDVIETHLAPATFRIFADAHENAEEHAVETLTRVFAKILPPFELKAA